MPRGPRIAYPGAVYHVVDRGNDRGDVFFDDEDRRFYLELLSKAVTGFRLGRRGISSRAGLRASWGRRIGTSWAC